MKKIFGVIVTAAVSAVMTVLAMKHGDEIDERVTKFYTTVKGKIKKSSPASEE